MSILHLAVGWCFPAGATCLHATLALIYIKYSTSIRMLDIRLRLRFNACIKEKQNAWQTEKVIKFK